MTVSPDVSYLQYVLDSNPQTIVASAGSGSASNLTNYFGSMTKTAVMRFQALYANDILTPAGLTNPTGNVGPLTIKKLNSLLPSLSNGSIQSDATGSASGSSNGSSGVNGATLASQYSLSTTPVSISASDFINAATSSASGNIYTLNDQSPDLSTQANNANSDLSILDFSTYNAVGGQVVSIFGEGFNPSGNTVYLGPVNIGSYVSSNLGSQISFVVPQAAPTGQYQISVANSLGTTTSGSIFLSVTNTLTANLASTTPTVAIQTTPTVTGVYPTTSSNINDLITVYGSYFSNSNTVTTNLGSIQGVQSSDGKSLSFLIGSLPYYQTAFSQYKGKAINVIIKVTNEYGKSDTSATLVINFPNTSLPTVNQNASSISSQVSNSQTGSSNSQSITTSSNGVSSGTAATTATCPSGYTCTAISNANPTLANVGTYPTQTQVSNALSTLGVGATTNAGTTQTTTSSGTNYTGAAIAVGAVAGTAIVASALGGGTAAASAGASAAGSAAGSSAGTSAAGTLLTPTFGGKILEWLPCLDGNVYMIIDDYSTNIPLTLIYDPKISRLDQGFTINSPTSVGAYVLGGYLRTTDTCTLPGDPVTILTALNVVDPLIGIGISPI